MLEKAPVTVSRFERTVSVIAWILGFDTYCRGGDPLRVLVQEL